MHSRRRFLGLTSASALLWLGQHRALSKTISLGNSGWLEVQSFDGDVVYQRRSRRQVAWKGLRLTQVGDRLESGANASATLMLDEGLGSLRMGERTQFWIKRLRRTSGGGRITQIHVERGQVHLKVRPMQNAASRLELHTPAGIAGVRGTEFGVVVQPSGKTSVATLSGRVDTEALRQTVAVGRQQQNLTYPQEAPQPAVPLRDNPDLQMSLARREGDRLLLSGQTDPVNLLLVEGVAQDTDREGKFGLALPVEAEAAVLLVQVVTPLGTQKRYELPLR